MRIINKYHNIIAVIIIIAATELALMSVWNDSPIVDEIPHIGAGYSYVEKGDYRLNPEHPPLVKDIAGLALQFIDVNNSAFETKYWSEDINGQWDFGKNFIFNSGNNAVDITHAVKIPILVFFILSAVIIFIWSKELFGPIGGLVSLFLFSFSPTVMAHSRFVATDMAALFGVLLSTYFYIKFLKKPNYKSLVIAGLAFGIAQLTKFSLFLLVPYFGILALIYGWIYHIHGHKLKHALHYGLLSVVVMAVGYMFVVWPIYGLHTMNYPPEKQKSDAVYLLGSYGNRKLADRVIKMSDKPIIRPMAQYALGLLMVNQRSVGGNTTYFLFVVRNQAWKDYFPIVYFIKEPLAFWGIVAIALFSLISRLKFKKLDNNSDSCFDQIAMLIWLAIYWSISIKANLNIGVRHLIPVYGFTYILLSGSIAEQLKFLNLKFKNDLAPKLLTFNLLLLTLFGWYLFENLKVYPYYLTYFNQAIGGPSNGYKYVVDSNLDWGQDAKRLADWIRDNNINEKVYLDYFGWSDQSYYYPDKYIYLFAGKYKSVKEFLNENPKGGWIAVSATFYMGSREKPDTSYAWLDNTKPVTVIGNSIFVWHLTKANL